MNEIKVKRPSALRFEVTNKRTGFLPNEFFGNLYLYDELLDDSTFLSLAKSMVAEISKETYDRVKDQLPPHEILDEYEGKLGGPYFGTYLEVLFDDIKDIKIVDELGLINEIKINTPGIKAQIYSWEASPERKLLYDKIATQTYSLLSKLAQELNYDISNFRASFDGLYYGQAPDYYPPNQTSLTIQIKPSDDTWKEPWTGNALIPQNVSGEALILRSYNNTTYDDSEGNPTLSQLLPVIEEKNLIKIVSEFALKIKNSLTPEEVDLIAPNTPILVTGKLLKEITVNRPSLFRFEIERKGLGDVYFGKFYLSSNLVDDNAIYNTYPRYNHVQFYLEKENPEFEKLTNLLKINNIEEYEPFSTDKRIHYVIDPNKVAIVNNLNEIKVNSPNIIEKQLYSRILSLYPEATMVESRLYGHIIYLFPGSKIINKNSIIVEPSGVIVVHLGDDSKGRRFKHINNLMKYVEDNPVEASIDEIKVKTPNSSIRFEASRKNPFFNMIYGNIYLNDTLLNDYAHLMREEGSPIIYFSLPSKTYETIENSLPPHEAENHPDDIVGITFKNLNNIKIINKLNEIKVNAPSSFRFEVISIGDQLQKGKLYFKDTLLDDYAVFHKDRGLIVTHIPSKIYDTIENILPSHNIMSTSNSGYNFVIKINDVSNVKIVNNLNEIKVNAPKPFTYDAYYYDENDNSTEGELYFNGELLDGDAVYTYGVSGDDKIYYIAFSLDTPTYARLFDSLSPYIHNRIIGGSTKRTLAQITDYPDNYQHTLIIKDLSKVNLKNLPPFINEIKVVTPGILGRLKAYKSQIEFTNDLKEKNELALKAIELVLPIFEKLVPNDKSPHEAIESAQVYLLNPTRENKLAISQVNLNSPGYPDAAKLILNAVYAVVWAVVTDDPNIKNALNSITYAIKAVEADQASQLDEIKINKPGKPFKLKVDSYEESNESYFGELYFNNKLLDDTTVYYPDKRNDVSLEPHRLQQYIVFELPLPVDQDLQQALLDNGAKITIQHSDRIFYGIKDLNNVDIVDTQGLVNEIKVNAPMDSRRPYIDNRYVDLKSIELEDVFQSDYPDFADAYISYAKFEDGTELTSEQLEYIQEEWPDLVNELAHNSFINEIKIGVPGWKNFNLRKVVRFDGTIFTLSLDHPELRSTYFVFYKTNEDFVTWVWDIEYRQDIDEKERLVNLLSKYDKPFELIPEFGFVKIPLSLINISQPIGEIKVGVPNKVFKFKTRASLGDGLFMGDLYFKNKIIDSNAFHNKKSLVNRLRFILPESVYQSLKNEIDPYVIEVSAYDTDEPNIVFIIDDLNSVLFMDDNVNEIKISTPNWKNIEAELVDEDNDIEIFQFAHPESHIFWYGHKEQGSDVFNIEFGDDDEAAHEEHLAKKLTDLLSKYNKSYKRIDHDDEMFWIQIPKNIVTVIDENIDEIKISTPGWKNFTLDLMNIVDIDGNGVPTYNITLKHPELKLNYFGYHKTNEDYIIWPFDDWDEEEGHKAELTNLLDKYSKSYKIVNDAGPDEDFADSYIKIPLSLIDVPVNEIKINKPKTKFEFPLMVNNQEEYDFYTDELLKSGKRWFENYDGTLHDISSIAWPYVGPDDDKFPFCIKTNYWKPEIIHAIPYSACKKLNEIKVQAPTKYRKGMYLIPKNKKVNNAFYIVGSPEKRYDKYREEYTNVYPYNFDDPNGETHGMIEEWYLDSRYKIGESAQSNTNEIKIQSPKNIIPLKFKKILTDHTGWRDGVIYSVDIEGFPETSVTIHDDEPDVVYLYPGQYAGDIKTKLDMLSIPYESLVNNILVDKKYFSNYEIN
jgi:hypothetical protein